MKEQTGIEKPENIIAGHIIRAAIEVHRELGPGLLESVYQTCLGKELQSAGMDVQRELVLPVYYKGEKTGQILRIDMLVGGLVIVEVKSSIELAPLFSIQLHTYLRIADKRIGLLINFNVPVLKDGIRRVVNQL